MIPISSDQVFKVKDPESSALLHLRYLTGQHLDRFSALQKSDVAIEKYRAQAEKNIAKTTHGKSQKEQAPLVAREMMRLAEADGIDTGNSFAKACEMVDIFLCGWEGEGWPKFPANGKPSSMFKMSDLLTLSELISEHIDELTGISVDEAKN